MRRLLTVAGVVGISFTTLAAADESGIFICGSHPGRRHLEYSIHGSFERHVDRGRYLTTAPATAEPVGNIVLMEGDGSIISEPNTFDLAGVSLVFTPRGGNTYHLRRDALPLESRVGNLVALGDDDTREIQIPFEFPFYGRPASRVFLNSDGNLTFDSGDKASTSRSMERFLSGPPRIALFFADLDPSQGGNVRVATLPDRIVITWERVPEFDKSN